MLDKALSVEWPEIKDFKWITWQDNADQISEILARAKALAAKRQ
jgi:hypothetical protein